MSTTDLAGHHVADGDAAMDLERPADLGGNPWHGREDGECGARSPRHVVAMRDGGAEQRHDAVADVLVDRAAVALDDGVDGAEETAEQRLGVLGAKLRGHGGETDQVHEQDRHLASLALGRRRSGCRERRTASAAETVAGFVREATGRTAVRQRGATGTAELPVRSVLGATPLATHGLRIGGNGSANNVARSIGIPSCGDAVSRAASPRPQPRPPP